MNFVAKVSGSNPPKSYLKETEDLFSAFEKMAPAPTKNGFGIEFTQFSLPLSEVGLDPETLNAVLKHCGGVGVDVDSNAEKANRLNIPETMPKAQLYWEKSGDMLHFTLRGKHKTFPAKALSEDAARIEANRAEGAKAMGR